MSSSSFCSLLVLLVITESAGDLSQPRDAAQRACSVRETCPATAAGSPSFKFDAAFVL